MKRLSNILRNFMRTHTRHHYRVGLALLVLTPTMLLMALGNTEQSPSPAAHITQTSSAWSIADPSELSPADIGRYSMAFAAQKKGEFEEANALLAQLDNRHLMGYVLAERYLNQTYKASKDELSHWLANYADHPHAPRIALLARERGLKASLPKAPAPLKGDGYTDHLGRSQMPDPWFTALSHWRSGQYSAARTIFDALANDESLNSWQASAAHYWAYRANSKTGRTSTARSHLREAAKSEATFYGMLAAKQLNAPRIRAEAPEVSDSLRDSPRAIRAALLVALDRPKQAEDELRQLYSESDSDERAGIVTLASELDMPNLQMRLARGTELSPEEAVFARYPAPYYMVELDHVADAALLMAVARNESGFRDVAQSEAGASGMMQMMPATARMVERRVGRDRLTSANNATSDATLAARLNTPALSARYGAEYIKMLAAEPAIKHNLIYMLVGYNAGPGTVISWKAASRNIKDPLLFIESIPYPETRNYVMQVSAQYWIYQQMMDERPSSLEALARGKWPMVKTGV